MKNRNQFWIGYGHFEDLLDADLADPNKVLYLNTCIESVPTSIGSMRVNQFSVFAARLDLAHGVCHYWQMLTGRTEIWAGDKADERSTAADLRTKKACELLEQSGAEKGFLVSKAIVAQPKDLTFLTGDTLLIRYDKESDLYLPAPAEIREAA